MWKRKHLKQFSSAESCLITKKPPTSLFGSCALAQTMKEGFNYTFLVLSGSFTVHTWIHCLPQKRCKSIFFTMNKWRSKCNIQHGLPAVSLVLKTRCFPVIQKETEIFQHKSHAYLCLTLFSFHILMGRKSDLTAICFSFEKLTT